MTNANGQPGSGTGAVLTFGEPLIAFVPNRAGKLEQVQGFQPASAGAELNTAVGLARLNVNASYAAAVGDDPFGQSLLNDLRANNVDAGEVVTRSGTSTAILFKQWFGRNNETSVYYYRALSPMGKGMWAPQRLLQRVSAGAWQWLHSTGITWMLHEQTRAEADQLFAAAHARGLQVSFDLNIRLKLAPTTAWRTLAVSVAPWVNWFFLGDEEARLVFGDDSAAAVEQSLRDQGFAGQGVVVKRGERGVEASVAGVITEAPAWPVQRVVDTVGAGDGFNAGFIAGMLRGDSLLQALKLGCLIGAYAVTSAGDCDGYPHWRDVVRDLEGGGETFR